MLAKILKYSIVLALVIALAKFALVKWESSETNFVLKTAIKSIVSGNTESEIEIVIQEGATIPKLSREYEITTSDNLLLWGYEYRIKFHSGHEVAIDVVPKIFGKSMAYVYFDER